MQHIHRHSPAVSPTGKKNQHDDNVHSSYCITNMQNRQNTQYQKIKKLGQKHRKVGYMVGQVKGYQK